MDFFRYFDVYIIPLKVGSLDERDYIEQTDAMRRSETGKNRPKQNQTPLSCVRDAMHCIATIRGNNGQT